MPNGNYVEVSNDEADKFYLETFKDSYFQISKSFYPKTGIIKRKGLVFNGTYFIKGVWSYFNESGKLVEEVDYDKPFKFTFEDILKF